MLNKIQGQLFRSETPAQTPLGLCISESELALVVSDSPHPIIYQHPLNGLGDLDSALALMIDKLNLRGALVNVVLSPECYQLLLVPQPQVPTAELEEAIRWQISDRLTSSVDKTVVRCFNAKSLLDREGGPQVYVAAVAETLLSVVGQCILSAGLCLQDIQIAELCIARFLNTLSSGPLSAAVVCNQHHGLTVVQHKGDFLFSRRFKFSSEANRAEDILNSIVGSHKYLVTNYGGRSLEVWSSLESVGFHNSVLTGLIEKQAPIDIKFSHSGLPLSLEAIACMGARMPSGWPELASATPLVKVA